MKRPLPLLLFILLNAVQHPSLAQDVNLDSLWAIWNDRDRHDTVRLAAIGSAAWGSVFVWPDSAYSMAELEFELAKKMGSKQKMAIALNTQGGASWIAGNYHRALLTYAQSKKLLEEIGDKKRIAAALSNMAAIYYEQGKYEDAITANKESLDIRTELDDRKGISISLINIGNVYRDQADHTNAIESFSKSLSIKEEIGDSSGIAICLNNIGLVYYDQNDLTRALSYYKRSTEIEKRIGNLKGLADSYNNIGLVYDDLKDTPNALDAYLQALSVYRQLENNYGIARTLNNLGNIHANEKNDKEALRCYIESLRLAKEMEADPIVASDLVNIARIYFDEGKTDSSLYYGNLAMSTAITGGMVIDKRDAAESLYYSYKSLNKSANALEMYELYITMRDSIMSEENQRAVLRQEYKYEYEKEALADSLVFAKKEALSQAEIKRKGQQRNALMGGLGLITLFSGLLYNRFRVTRKQKEVIEVQKAEVEEKKEQVEKKNDEIMASITYAKKLQTAVLPPARVVKEYFSQSFLLYLPRDIVSGDFYWMESNNDVSYFAVADCTGHGVPGAMLSVIGMNGLNRALNEQHLTQPKDILTSLSEHIQRHFEQSEATVRDGMDICLCTLDNKTMKLTYAGANNPVWIVRNGEMHILKADRRAIGHDDQNRAFTQQEFQLQKGDTVYLSSDGYQDQIGGEKNRKLMTKVFRERLVQLSALPMDEQRQTLLTEHEAWKGSGHQTDDICVMAIRV